MIPVIVSACSQLSVTVIHLAGQTCTRTGRAGAGHRRRGGDERVPSDRLLDVGSNQQ